MLNKKINMKQLISALPFCLLFFYVLIRAAVIDITHDEAYSFYNVKHFWWVETLCTGNTHWFNFLAIKTAVLLSLEKVVYLRWFTLVSAGVFLFLTYQWINMIELTSVKVLAFSVVLLNPYLLDYFSLARGYSSGLMFEALALFYFMKAIKEEKRINCMLTLFSAGMSAIANFNFFYFFSAFIIVYFYFLYLKKGLEFFKSKWFYVDVIFSLGIVALVLKALWFIKDCSNDIGAYGGNDFVDSIFSGYIKGFIYHNYSLNPGFLMIAVYTIFLLVTVASVFGLIWFKKHQSCFYQIVSMIILLVFGFSIFNKWVFHVLYPIDRTTLMLFPLFAIVLIKFLQVLLQHFKYKAAVFLSISALLFFNFLLSINVKTTYDYWEHADAKSAFMYLEKIKPKKVGITPELYGVFRNYYQMTDKYHFSFVGESINTYFPKGLSDNPHKLREFDYLLLFPPYDLSFYRFNKVEFSAVKYYSKTGTIILKIR